MKRGERELRQALRGADVPGEASARERAWRVVDAAFADRAPVPRRMPWRPVAVIAAAGVAVVAAVAVALTPPGDAVGRWVRQIVRPAATPHAHSVLRSLPGHGRLLVSARTGAWILQADGTRRRLGAYDAATFSGPGRYVAVARGNMLAAVDLRGRVHWTLTRPRAVNRPAWSPDGLRVAYRTGSELRVVYGDGALDRRLARRSAPVTPAWMPSQLRRLVSVAPDGRTVVQHDPDTGERLWRADAGGRVLQLAWSADGRRLLAVTPRAIRVLTPGGRTVRVVRAPRGERDRRAAWLPGRRAFVVLRSAAGGLRSEVSLGGRTLLALPGRLSDVIASPDGRWLLLPAPAAHQWLLVRTSGSGRLTALSNVGRQFDPGGRGAAPLPRPLSWR